MNNSLIPLKRIAAIDIFRALTMLCMIFVNHFWSITNVPHWLEHAAANEDFLGFSDIVFPAFLFILGTSLPFAIESRFKKGHNKTSIAIHIALRSLALIIMGIFTLSSEAGVGENSLISKPLFSTLMIVGFLLIWNVYPKSNNKYLYPVLQGIGIILLIIIALLYRNSNGGYISTSWWGILGLIGWTYLICAFIYLFARSKIIVHGIAYLAFIALAIISTTIGIGPLKYIIVGGGSLHLFTIAGVLTSLYLIKNQDVLLFKKIALTLIAAGILSFAAGTISHSFWIVSKLQGTLTWVFFCTSLILISYLFIHWLVQIKGKGKWFNTIKTAGTSTLTCYLIPYIAYAILFGWLSYTLPAFINSGFIGLIKCLAFSFGVIGIAYLLGKINIKLKI